MTVDYRELNKVMCVCVCVPPPACSYGTTHGYSYRKKIAKMYSPEKW